MDYSNTKIDLVYLWVDGSDIEWAKRKAKMLSEIADIKLNSDSIDRCRFQDNNELLYSLRSVEKNLPWINHIYIVTANQKPSWLNLDHKKITLVSHDEIMDDYSLPTFNACSIESYLTRIPNLSEYFIYANDDMFFFNETKPELFFDKEMKPIYQMGKKIFNKPYNHLYGNSVVKGHNLIKKKFNKSVGYFPHHGVDPYKKSYIDECIEIFKEEFETTRHNHFRSFSDLQRTVFAYYAIVEKGCKFEIAPEDSYAECRKGQLEALSKSKFPLACINSGRKTKPDDIEMMKNILQNKFPKISSFENNKRTINVCFVANDSQAEDLYFSLLSILKSKNPNESITAWIINSGIKEQNINNIKSFEKNFDCSINFVELNIKQEDKEKLLQENHIRACCNILFSDAIKSDRVIYMDNNVNVNQSLLELYDSDFEENYILSAVDITSRDNLPSVKIVNCGIMLINLDNLRKSNIKYKNDISDVITADKIKYIKNNIKMASDRNRFTSPFGIFHPTELKNLVKNIFPFKSKDKVKKVLK